MTGLNNSGVVAATKRDYYEVLGVHRDADEGAIRRAFRAQARDWHPDVAGSPEAEHRFRELAEAYSVLSSPEARLLYDLYGYRGRGNRAFEEVISDAVPDVVHGEDVRIKIDLRRFEARDGARRVVRYQALARCPECLGHGMAGDPDPECEYCGGTGRIETVSEAESPNPPEPEPCPVCIANPCSRCDGTGTVVADRRVRLIIPAGIEDEALRESGVVVGILLDHLEAECGHVLPLYFRLSQPQRAGGPRAATDECRRAPELPVELPPVRPRRLSAG